MELRADSVTLNRDRRALVSAVDIVVNEGELVGLIGPNGAGKSTLLAMLCGFLKCDAGEIYLGESPLSQFSIASRARTIGYVEQSGPVNWPLTVERIVALGRRPHLSAWQKLNKEDYVAIDRAIAATDCDHLRMQDATTLSGGERTRMMLARALAAEPTILLADEPIATLDLGHQLQTMELLRGFATQQQSCIAVLHDLSLAARYCDRLYLMKKGTMVAEGAPNTVLNAQNIRAVYDVDIETGTASVPWIVPIRRVHE